MTEARPPNSSLRHPSYLLCCVLRRVRSRVRRHLSLRAELTEIQLRPGSTASLAGVTQYTLILNTNLQSINICISVHHSKQ